MSFLNLDSGFKTFEAGTFEGLSNSDLLGAMLVELRVISTYLYAANTGAAVDEPETLRQDIVSELVNGE